jgi:hypothetical protein
LDFNLYDRLANEVRNESVRYMVAVKERRMTPRLAAAIYYQWGMGVVYTVEMMMDRYDPRTQGLPDALAAIVYEHAGYINPYYRRTLGEVGNVTAQGSTPIDLTLPPEGPRLVPPLPPPRGAS